MRTRSTETAVERCTLHSRPRLVSALRADRVELIIDFAEENVWRAAEVTYPD
jgi:hypothetical protein